ncbi:uncharacterized protein M421DRAFT_407781 [Didymella exigua CBS 183.55]|uniref:Uncharacterized protein n=1 Tax=Didymella exigua CBS 183.55 TaxID=1150837 RepID=A0A6A5R769_9PLEO|nr:uncharacterized protein M421DRAFT_407781 [Didymella exigua CBS 183.55]KAF1923028.1 hypothetical protein M421DRAFT_407781 [Didymella exigua CBS 183.55]
MKIYISTGTVNPGDTFMRWRTFIWTRSTLKKINFARGKLQFDRSSVPRQINLQALEDFLKLARQLESTSSSREEHSLQTQVNGLPSGSEQQHAATHHPSANAVIIHRYNSTAGVQLDLKNTDSGEFHIHFHVDKLKNVSGLSGMTAGELLRTQPASYGSTTISPMSAHPVKIVVTVLP